eukprot:TRINITY_DN5988_c0_g1_i2.p1 TRINITY_DN5988_c0_g1~~TRINITY_DN5988_c0_g1_i2.p1  ORF type:complete len:507 (+),score=115.02 TRINITY_DN5988_c0_g1_i2:140-1660(+)
MRLRPIGLATTIAVSQILPSATQEALIDCTGAGVSGSYCKACADEGNDGMVCMTQDWLCGSCGLDSCMRSPQFDKVGKSYDKECPDTDLAKQLKASTKVEAPGTTNWKATVLKKAEELCGIHKMNMDMCAYTMTAKDGTVRQDIAEVLATDFPVELTFLGAKGTLTASTTTAAAAGAAAASTTTAITTAATEPATSNADADKPPAASCRAIGCDQQQDASLLPCQCDEDCGRRQDCCIDFVLQCEAYKFPLGGHVALYAKSNGKFLTVTNSDVSQGPSANASDAPDATGRFHVIPAGNAQVYLYNRQAKRFIVAKSGDLTVSAAGEETQMPGPDGAFFLLKGADTIAFYNNQTGSVIVQNKTEGPTMNRTTSLSSFNASAGFQALVIQEDFIDTVEHELGPVASGAEQALQSMPSRAGQELEAVDSKVPDDITTPLHKFIFQQDATKWLIAGLVVAAAALCLCAYAIEDKNGSSDESGSDTEASTPSRRKKNKMGVRTLLAEASSR